MRISVSKHRILRVASIAAILVMASLLATAPCAAEPSVPPLAVAQLNRISPVDFETEILPLLRDNCLACHNRTRAKADLVLETPADILKGGENGPVVVPG